MKAKSRRECFFGLHFDFHAMEGDEIGQIIDTESIENMLDETKPDMIQVDSKGHPGISSYMTKAGRHADVMHMDVLRVWRKLTEERGIRLYAHHSGLYDQTQAKRHPEWAVVSAEGIVSEDFMSPFSPYVDQVLIPQILEIAGEYRADGVWVDGDAWGAYVDYSENGQRAWKKEKGRPVPYPADADYEEYREFCREGFRRYVMKYVQAVKDQYPEFEVTSNWIYSQLVPEKRTIPVDFLSGDYDCRNSVRSARAIGLCFNHQDITWDLMAWGQNATPVDNWVTRNRCTKEAEQLCQEAAVVLSQGGGFQFFNILYGTGGMVQKWAIPSWKRVAEFCREREAFCFQAKSIAEIAVVFPEYYGSKLFGGGAWKSVSGWVGMIKDIGYSCDVLYEADCEDLKRYKVVVLPSSDCYKKATLEAVETFVSAGGTVIADGGSGMPESLSGVHFAEAKERLFFLDDGEGMTALETNYYAPAMGSAHPMSYCHRQNYFYEPEREISAVLNQVGDGKVISLCFALGPVYEDNITYVLRQYVKALFHGYVPLVSVEGSSYADVTLMEKNGSIMVNIINMAGDHNTNGVRTFREIPAIGPLTIRIRTGKAPKAVYWQPEGRRLELEDTGDGYCCKVDVLKIHGILEVAM